MRAPDRATPVLVLTCRLSPPGRVAHARAQAEALFGPGRAVVIEGVIGSDPQVDALLDAPRARLLSKRPPGRGEIAAYATHRLAWERLLAGGAGQALVLEDDFRAVDTGLVRAVAERAGDLLSGGANIVKLFDFPRDRRARNACIRRRVAGIPLVKWRHPRAGMVAYLISREGAARFLARRAVFRAVDEDIKHFWELGLDVWSVPGNPVVDASAELGGSLLEEARQAGRRRGPLRSLHGLVLSAHRDWRTRQAFQRRTAALAAGERLSP